MPTWPRSRPRRSERGRPEDGLTFVGETKQRVIQFCSDAAGDSPLAVLTLDYEGNTCECYGFDDGADVITEISEFDAPLVVCRRDPFEGAWRVVMTVVESDPLGMRE